MKTVNPTNQHVIAITNPSGEIVDFGLDENLSTRTPRESMIYAIQGVNKVLHPVNTLEKIISNGNPSVVQGVATLGMEAAKTAIGLAMTDMNRYFTLKEDYISQNNINKLTQTYNNIQTYSNKILSSTIAGAASGSAIGAVIGFGAGVVSSIVTIQSTNAQKIEQYQMQLATINQQVSFGESRASLINGGHGTEN